MPVRPRARSRAACTGPSLTSDVVSDSGRSRSGISASGPAVVTRRSSGVANSRRTRGLAEGVDHVDGRLRVGVDQVERLAVVARRVREVVHGLGDVVDGHHVRVAQVDADERQPGGQVVAQRLHHREEVVGAVDLVHRPGLGVADDDRGPVDPPGDLGLLADDPLGLVLRPVVRRRQVLALGRTSSRRSGRGTRRPRRRRRPGGRCPTSSACASSRAWRVPPTFIDSFVASSAVMS